MLISTNVASLRSISVRCESRGQLDLSLMRRAQQALVNLERLTVICDSFGVRTLDFLSSWSQLTYLRLYASYVNWDLTREHALAFGRLPSLRSLTLLNIDHHARYPWVLRTLLENVPTQIERIRVTCRRFYTQYATFGEDCMSIMNRRFEGKCADFSAIKDRFCIDLLYHDECVAGQVCKFSVHQSR